MVRVKFPPHVIFDDVNSADVSNLIPNFVYVNPYNIASPIDTDHLARPFFSGPNVKEKGSLGDETCQRALLLKSSYLLYQIISGLMDSYTKLIHFNIHVLLRSVLHNVYS